MSGFNSERCPASFRNDVRLRVGTVSGIAPEYPSGFNRISQWEIVLSNKRQLARSDRATPEDAKREAEAALRELPS
jgi:hypothetical protein